MEQSNIHAKMTITKAFSFPISISDLDRTYSLENKVCETTTG